MPGPRGRHGWRGGRGLQRGQIARLVEPCLLTLLQDGNRHGYDLIAALERFGLDPALLDSGLVYRVLREMEGAGWVVSTWEAGPSGPARRVYSLTAAGREALTRWRDELGRTHDLLHRLLHSEP
ncbi:MAG: helix-turn-helix transcriptional regulator [Anaerolineae bacterium]|nr:helix-turn-helix transcriptional regulator [Anaerolineae bacterium]